MWKIGSIKGELFPAGGEKSVAVFARQMSKWRLMCLLDVA